MLHISEYFDICGTRIPYSTIKDYRVINVEFILRPVFRESKKAISRKKYEFDYMEPYAAIIGQQGHKSELGEYRPKDFKEALAKDISGALIYTIADKLKLKAFKQQRYQCINLAGRAFTSYLDDIPVKMLWADGRIAEVYKEDKLHAVLNEITTPGINYYNALVIKASETFSFFGNGIQIADANYEFERLKYEFDLYTDNRKKRKIGSAEKLSLPSFQLFHLSQKSVTPKEEQDTYREEL